MSVTDVRAYLRVVKAFDVEAISRDYRRLKMFDVLVNVGSVLHADPAWFDVNYGRYVPDGRLDHDHWAESVTRDAFTVVTLANGHQVYVMNDDFMEAFGVVLKVEYFGKEDA